MTKILMMTFGTDELQRLIPCSITRVKNIGAGSDHAAFVAFVGVPSVDIRFTYDYSLNISSYPLYHTAYDSHNSYSSFQDPGFKVGFF